MCTKHKLLKRTTESKYVPVIRLHRGAQADVYIRPREGLATGCIVLRTNRAPTVETDGTSMQTRWGGGGASFFNFIIIFACAGNT